MEFLNLFLEGGQAGSQLPEWTTYVVWGVFGVAIVIALVLSSRKNKKKQQEEMNRLNSLAVGDEVTTIGGIIGKVVRTNGDQITIESGRDRTKLCISRNAISDIKKH